MRTVYAQDNIQSTKDEYNVPRFLNRVLALEVDQQNALFDYFANLFDQTVSYAKANGTFDEGVTDIKALAVRIARPPRIVHTDEITGAQTTHYTLEVDLPSKAVSFEEAEQVRKQKGGASFATVRAATLFSPLNQGAIQIRRPETVIGLSRHGNPKRHM